MRRLARLAEPAPGLADEERRRARLILGLSAWLAPVALLASTAVPWLLDPTFSVGTTPGSIVGIAASVGMALTWAIARTGRLRLASWTLVTVGFGAVWGAAAVSPPLEAAMALFSVGLLVLLAGLVLRVRAAAFVVAVNLAAMLLFPFAFPAVALADVTSPFIFLGVLSTLVLVEAGIRQRNLRQLEAQAQAVAESEERYRLLFDASFEGLAVDVDGVVLDGNARFGPMFGYSEEEVGEMPLAAFLQPADADVLDTPPEGRALEVEGRRKDGSAFPLVIVQRSGAHRGRPARVTAWRDLTETKRAEAEVDASRKRIAMNEKLSALGTLVAGVGHEINNPLAFMRGTVELHRDILRETLARDDLTGPVRDAVHDVWENEETVLRGIERIEQITSSLKRVARASDGERRPEDMNTLIDSVLTVAGPRLKGGTTVDRDLRARSPAAANGGELSQVLLNLVFNAADAVQGRPGARILVRSFESGSRVVVEVEDNGPGVPTTDAAQIFTPFHTTKPHGTGLGLSTSWRIMEDHGGALAFTSEPGRTVFRIEIPAAVSAPRTR